MKGQMTIQGVLFVFLTVVFLAVLSPILNSFLGMAAGNATAAGDTTTATIINLIPTMLWVGVFVGIVIYTIAPFSRGQEQGG
jgi:hypothetical protein